MANRTNGNGQAPTANQQVLQELVGNVMLMRRELLSRFLDPRRDIGAECGFPAQGSLTAQMYQDLYDREAVAARVVEVLPKDCWQTPPTIYESEDGDVSTPFEKAWDELGKQLRGEKSWYQDEEGNPVWSYLLRADILSGIGQYGVILLGLDDGKQLSEPVEWATTPSEPTSSEVQTYRDDGSELNPPGGGGDKYGPGQLGTDEEYVNFGLSKRDPDFKGKQKVETPTGKKNGRKSSKDRKGKGARKLLYLRVFPEALAQITRFESDIFSPRFGQPLEYTLTFNDPGSNSGGIGLSVATVTVHWSRCIHIVDNLASSEVFGVPRMQPVLNNLIGLQKLYGGSPEMYWRGAFPGMSLETAPGLGGDVDFDAAATRDMMEQYMNGLQRYLALNGLTAKTLAPTVVDPTPQITVQLQAIAIRLGMPMRKLMGSERGELSSTEDEGDWNDKASERQNNHCNPNIIVPFVDRLIAVGVLPEPSGYSSYWPALDAQSEQEKATIAQVKTAALAQYVSGGVEALIPPLDYLTRILEMDEEEAQEILDNAAKHLEEVHPEADQGVVPGHGPAELAPVPPVIGPDGKPIPGDAVGEGGKPIAKGGQPAMMKNPDEEELTKLLGNVDDCGTGAGGFKPGNTCGAGGSGRIESIVKGHTFEAFQIAKDKGRHVEEQLSNLAKGLGLQTKIKVLGDVEFESTIGKSARSMGADPRVIRAAYTGGGTDQVTFRERTLKGITDKNSYRLFLQTAYHEIGHAYEAQVLKKQTVSEKTLEGYYQSRQEDFADVFGSRLGLIRLGRAKVPNGDIKKYLTSNLWVPITNAFCPTGKEGGIDPSCSPSKSKGHHPVGAAIGHPSELIEGVGHGLGSGALHHVGAAGGTLGSVMAAIKMIGGKTGAGVEHMEHVAKAYLKDRVGEAVAKIPSKKAQAAVNAAFAAGALTTKTAFGTWTSLHKVAERISQQRGNTEEEARRFRGVLMTADVALSKAGSTSVAVLAGAATGGLSSFLPLATSGYLAYSTARNPMQVSRAADTTVKEHIVESRKASKGLIRRAIDKVRGLAERFTSPAELIGVNALIVNAITNIQANAIADALAKHHYEDWYIALLHSAMNEVDDLEEAIAVADGVYRLSPEYGPSRAYDASSLDEV